MGVNLMHQRTYLHYSRLGEHITSDTCAYSSLFSVAKNLYQQAQMLSYIDTYWLMGLTALSVLWLPLLFKE